MLKIAWNEKYSHPLPEGHRFPMAKYELIPEQLIYEGTISEASLFSPDRLSPRYITNTHDQEYWQKLQTGNLTRHEIRKTGFPYSAELVEREVVIMKGTVMGVGFAMKHGIAFNVAGGTHHAYAGHGEGFCLLNDLAIAANYALANQMASRILIVDLDVHQGNGTATLFQGNDNVFTFSMHGAKNYPARKETSDLDLPLAPGTEDTTYLQLLEKHLPRLIDDFQPGLILYQAGVDILFSDQLGKLKVSIDGCKKRDHLVLSLCKRHRVPVVVTMGGGYSHLLNHIITAHANTYHLANELFF